MSNSAAEISAEWNLALSIRHMFWNKGQNFNMYRKTTQLSLIEDHEMS